MEFSCNSCRERRTKRLINRLAYERGLVFVQVQVFGLLNCPEETCYMIVFKIIFFLICFGSVVDVLSIISWLRILVIVEYDFRKETSKDSSTDQI